MKTPPDGSLRLFYALWPDDATRSALQRLQARVKGRLTRYENLHITLAFLGEQPEERLPLLKAILADLPPFELTLHIDRFGHFNKSRIAWAGMHAAPRELYDLQSALSDALVRADIDFDNRGKYTPHVTLARDAGMPPDAPFDTIVWQANEAALVHSLMENGRLTYKVLACRDLSTPG